MLEQKLYVVMLSTKTTSQWKKLLCYNQSAMRSDGKKFSSRGIMFKT
jgi:hypothetical protein